MFSVYCYCAWSGARTGRPAAAAGGVRAIAYRFPLFPATNYKDIGNVPNYKFDLPSTGSDVQGVGVRWHARVCCRGEEKMELIYCFIRYREKEGLQRFHHKALEKPSLGAGRA
ncbi:unnamed protein product, partial [Brenthis ino]